MPAVKLVTCKRGFLFIDMTIRQLDGESHRFLLDTGAERTLLSPKLTEGLRRSRPVLAGGVGGSEWSYAVYGQFNMLGKTITEAGKSPALLDQFAKEMGFEISGIIGQDLLSQFSSYTIDNKKGQFIFTL